MFYSDYLVRTKRKTPFIDINDLPIFNYHGFNMFIKPKYKLNRLKAVKRGLKKEYLFNCTIEIHNGKPKIVLAKRDRNEN